MEAERVLDEGSGERLPDGRLGWCDLQRHWHWRWMKKNIEVEDEDEDMYR